MSPLRRLLRSLVLVVLVSLAAILASLMTFVSGVRPLCAPLERFAHRIAPYTRRLSAWAGLATEDANEEDA